MKSFLYVIAALMLTVFAYALIEGVTVVTVKNESGSVETDGPLKKAIDKKSTLFCEIESFWAKYDIWGDTDTVYGLAEKVQPSNTTIDESIDCDSPDEDSPRQ